MLQISGQEGSRRDSPRTTVDWGTSSQATSTCLHHRVTRRSLSYDALCPVSSCESKRDIGHTA